MENVVFLSDDIYDFVLYDNKIWYEYIDRGTENYTHIFVAFDLATGETTKFDNGGIGLINNGYMYYIEDSNKLLRFNLSNYECEVVCESNGDSDIKLDIEAFNFYESYILYSSDGSIYKLSDNENTLIFSAQNFFDTDYSYRIANIQCQDNRIFIKIASGAFYQCIMEIDIDGNVIEVIHED